MDRANSIHLNKNKLQFECQGSSFFGYRLMPDGLKVDPDLVKAIF